MSTTFQAYGQTDVGLVRSANEDSIGSKETLNGFVYTVCDGMGGHVGGATASALAVKSILEYFDREVYENMYIAINHAIQFANEQIYAHAQMDPTLKGMGTTCTVLVTKGHEVFIGHVGDSRIYLYSDHQLNRLTKDHSFVQSLVDQGIIPDSEAENHPRKNELLKALGIRPSVEPTVCSAPILPKKGDVFMMCSDGLCGLVNDSAMADIMSSGSLETQAQQLIQAAKDAGGHDNITVQLVECTASDNAASVFTHYNPATPKSFEKTTQTTTIFQDPPAEVAPAKNKKSGVIIGILILAALVLIAWFFIFRNNGKNNWNGTDSTGEELIIHSNPDQKDSPAAKNNVVVQPSNNKKNNKDTAKPKKDSAKKPAADTGKKTTAPPKSKSDSNKPKPTPVKPDSLKK
ncbi:MAG: hypothetical protein Fur0041_00280 [Bacteroidia bacterium]